MERSNNDVIYEIYPLTFNYAPGSASDPYKGAYGNLKGITEHAGYIKALGVDAIWIAPFFKWNRNGFGYDITDYYAVDPMFGTLEDFEKLCFVYHSFDIRVYIDQVYNHCSEKHPWFQKSIQQEAPYKDYFVWRNAKGFDSEGKPIVPNNWPSTWDFSGESVWMWNEQRQQFYMHSFDCTMPNLNINNPEVQDELLKIARHWFDLGVDGFRLDATTHYGYDELFRDNPLDENGKQRRIYDINNEVGCRFIDRLKALSNTYPQAKTLLSEFVFDKGKDGNKKGEATIQNSICDAFYIGSLKDGLVNFKEKVTEALRISPNGEKLNWAFSNHDLERAATRIFGNEYSVARMSMLMNLLMTLPGSICIYQGDELGMPNPIDLKACKNPENDPRDVWSIAHNPWDGARAGFCMTSQRGDPSIKMALHPDARQYTYAVTNQKGYNSTLASTIRAIEQRKNGIFNRPGNINFIESGDNPLVIAFIRTDASDENAQCLCLFNFSEQKVIICHDDVMYRLSPESMIIK